MSYTTININYNESTLCEEINFSEPGERNYTPGEEITLSDSRLSRSRSLVVMNVNYTEDGEGGLSTTVSGFSPEYKYTRKAPNCDISFFTMTSKEQTDYEKEDAKPDSEVYIMRGDKYGAKGWTMYSIAQKIAEWMDLTIINNLPDYDISDFSISLGGTFFEALNGLVSEFEPLIVLVGGTLYILERNGAGALNSGGITPIGFTNRSVDGEYIPKPGCIRVEGSEGKYIASKDPAIPPSACARWKKWLEDHPLLPLPPEEVATPCNLSWTTLTPASLTSSGGRTTSDGSTTFHNVTEKYIYSSEGDKILVYRRQVLTFIDVEGHSSHTATTATYEYDEKLFILLGSTESCSAEISGALRVHSKVYTSYEHDNDWMLTSQITSRHELFIFDGTDYIKHDARDYDLEALDDGESFKLMPAEIRTTRYSEIDPETYGVATTVASKVWSEDDTEWKTSYAFENDIVEAGSLQRNTRTGKTLQVYAGDCPVFEKDRYIQTEDPDLPGYYELTVFSEPAKIFSISTPSWTSIENCHVYLAALVSTEFQKASTNVPIIDPLPLMSIGGLGGIIEREIRGDYYVRGYTINIDPNSGYTTSLNMEARKSA